MAMTVGDEKGGPQCEMNVTPLIDVLLVLIIIFMIIQTRSKSMGEEALVPQPPERTTDAPPFRTVVIQLVKTSGEKPSLMINQEQVAWDRLRSRLLEIYKTRAERVMFVKADSDLPFEDVAEVIDVARADFPDMKVGLITAKIESGG